MKTKTEFHLLQRSPAESEMRSVGLQNSEGKSEFKQHNNYYQWVSFVLFIQALLIYLPRYLWKGHENRINRSLRLDAELDLLDSTKIERVRNYIIGYLLKKPKICHNSSYYLHVLCEVANLLMVLGQFILMNAFLNANFTSYGLKVLQYGNWSNENFFDPMTRAFPKLVKCLFHSYGSSGSVQKSDYLCLLPYNLVNERTYLFLWFWFQLLILLSVINLIYRLLAACSHEVRCAMIMSKTECAVDRTALSSIVYNVSVGEWYILEILAENLDSELFDGIVTGIYEILAQKKEFSNRSD